MRRIEGLGIKPHDILAFAQGDGEMRQYRIPKQWVRRPYPPDDQKKGRHKSVSEWEAQWESEGINTFRKVQHTAYHFAPEENETTINFLETEPLAEINTCRKDWHRRLENEAARPESIDAARDGGGEFRWYKVPNATSGNIFG
jgi:hypothetical protein